MNSESIKDDSFIQGLIYEIQIDEQIKLERKKNPKKKKGGTPDFHPAIPFGTKQFEDDVDSIVKHEIYTPEFWRLLILYMEKYGFSNSTLAVKAGISVEIVQKYTSSGYKSIPKKKYIAAIGIVMGIDNSEMQMLMESAGYTYPAIIKRNTSAFNKVIYYCIEYRETDIDRVNRFLKRVEDQLPQLKKRKGWYCPLT